MGTLKFSMKMLVKDYKKNLFYGLTLIFAVAVCFIFCNIINNEYLVDQAIASGGGTWSDVEMPFSSVLSFLIIGFCCFMIFFANDFFLSRKTTELAIMAMSGSGYINSTMYVLYQSFTLLLLATPLGIGIGRIFVPISNNYMYDMLNVNQNPAFIPKEAYIYSFLLVAIVLSMICILTAGFLHRNDIQTLLTQEKEMKVKRNTKMFKTILFLGLYIFGIIMMFMNPHSSIAYIAPTIVGLTGAIGVIKYVFPDFIGRLKKGILLTKRYILISISNLNYSLQRSLLLFSLMTIAVTEMMIVLSTNQNSPREFTTGLIGYVVVVVLLVVSIIYKLSMEAMTRKGLFFNLWKIGYTKKELKIIIRQEVLGYYVILLLLPLIYIAFIAGRFIYYGEMSVSFVLIYVISYIVPIIISAIITYYQYIQTVVKPIKGGK